LVAGITSVETVSSAKHYNSATATLSTTNPGDLLVAFVGSDSPTTGGNNSVVSGAGLTWIKSGSENAQLGDAEIWTARAPGTLTNARITATQTTMGWDEALTVVAFENSTGIGATSTSNGSTGAPSGTLTTTGPDSWVWAMGDDWLKSVNRVPGTGQKVVHQATDKVGDTYWVQTTTAATPAAGTPVTISDTSPTADPYNMVLVEIRGTTVPTVTGVVPSSGPVSGSNAVTVDGTSLGGATEVDFGPAKITSGIMVAPGGNSLTVEAPPGSAGTVDVRVTTPAGQTAVSAADQYSYVAPPPTAYSGAQLTLSPGTAGPDTPHTSQTLKATLTDSGGNPLAGMEIAFSVTGANHDATSVPTDANGDATFTYTGDNAGTDTVTGKFAAGPDTVTSKPSTVTWTVPTTPVATVSMDPVQGQFFAEPSSATTFAAQPGDTPAFGQTFPDLVFNPSAGIISGDHFPPSPTTTPFTDVTTDVSGDANGTIPAQGNGQQAGVGGLASFDAVFTTTLHVSQGGDYSYSIDSADGFLLGIGNGASRVNGDFINPPASGQSAFDSYPLVAVSNQPSGGTVGTHPVTIHFPAAGDYPVELDYFSTGGPDSSLVLQPSAAVPPAPNTPPLNVYVGYEDTVRAANDYTISPLPWYGSPGVTFEGDATAQGSGSDSGGIRFDNVTNAPVTIDKLTVDIPVPGGAPAHFDQWPSGMVVPPGQTLILAEDAGYPSFDTSDVDPGACGVVQQLVPLINVTIGGVTTAYQDTGEVLNTGGFDLACEGNESQPWVRVGTTGPANPPPPPPAPAAAAALPPATILAISPGLSQSYPAGQAQTFTVSAVNSVGQPEPGLPVNVKITGTNARTQTVTTGANGTATFSDPGTVPGPDQVQATATVGTATVASNLVNLTWTAPAGPPPAIAAAQPADGSVVRGPVHVTATITPPAGQAIATWAVTAQSSAPGSPVIKLASGTGSPPSPLTTFDPTVLANGQYDLTVTATASGGGTQTLTSAVSVAGAMKLGAYQATYHEFTLPVDGVTFSIDRVYSSIDHSAGDFGTGWHVSLSDFQVGTGRALGAGGWQQYITSCGILSCNYAYAAQTVTHSVTVTWPDGHQEIWDLAPTGASFGGLLFISPGYTPRPGTNTTDTLTSDGSLAFGDDGNLYNSTLAQASDGTIFSPTQFTLTTPDGTVHVLSTTTGLVSETTSAGVKVTVNSTGVHASDGQSISFTRDPANGNRITQIAGPDDGVNGQDQHWTYGYNAAGQLVSVTDPVTTVHYSYDPSSGELLQSTDANNQPLTTITYTPDGRVATIAQGSNPPTKVTASTATDSQTTADPNGQLVTTDLYDTNGDLVEKDQAVGSKTLKNTYAYDSSGRLTSTTGPTGATATTSYDETAGPTNGDILTQTDADGRTTTYTAYSQNGQPGETINPDDSVADVKTFDTASGLPLTDDVPGLAPTTYTYNPDGTVANMTNPSGVKITYTYDANGNQARQSDGAGDTIQTVDDATGQTVREIDAAGHETDFSYDGNGNVTSMTNIGKSATETATYNGFNEPLTVTDADGHAMTYTYDTSGKLTKRVSPDGVVTTYTYDADGNLAAETTPTGATHYTYDPLGELIEADNPASQLTFTYDNAGQLLTQTSCALQPSGQPCPSGSPAVTHAVDPAGLITAATTPAGVTAYTYNNGKLATTTDLAGGVFVYGYDAQGRQATLTRPNGTADLETYNDVGQPLSLTTTGHGGATLAKATDTIDPATGLITQMTDLAGANTYTYNPNGTLAAATHPAATGLASESYTYDSAGNRLTGPTSSVASTYDKANRLLSAGSTTYTWNGEGDLASKTNTATGTTTTYTWDADNRLISTKLSTGGGTTETYDPLGRLISETNGTQTTTNLWDGETLVQQSTGTAVANVVSNPVSGDPSQAPATTLEITTGTSSVYPFYNLHGDLTGAATSGGTLTGPLAEYSAFGMSNSTVAGSPATFDAYDSSLTGEDASKARYYDPATGRFLSQDPNAALNAYSYTGDNPINHWDPTGAEELVEFALTTGSSIEVNSSCQVNATEQSIAASFFCLAGPGVSSLQYPNIGLGNVGIPLPTGEGSPPYGLPNLGYLATAISLQKANNIVQATIPFAELRADAQTSPLSGAVVDFVQLFFGYNDLP
jgi:RHS repeat-associated protein